MLECIGLCHRRVKEFEVSNYFVNISALFFDREVRGSAFSRSQSSRSCFAVRIYHSSDTTSRLNLKRKLC